MTESRIWAGGLLAILMLALLCTWVQYTPPTVAIASNTANTSATPALITLPAITLPKIVAPTPALNLRSESVAGVVTLTGDVPSEADKASIIVRAIRIYGVGKVIDKLRLDGSGKPEGFDTFAAQFPPDLRDSFSSLAYAQNGRMVLEGEVPSANAKASIEENAAKAFSPSLKIDSRLTVRAPAQPTVAQTAAPAQTEPPPARAESATATKPARTINFATSSSTLSKKARLGLRAIARDFEAYDSTTRLGLAGFTDSRGSTAANLKLSQQRALSVKAYLTKLGISAERLSTEAKGTAEPVADNDKVEGRRQNRRVEVRLL